MCAVLVLVACTAANLDLCVDEHPHKGQLIVEYDWGAVGDEHPDSMVVVALRPVFRDKVASNWATNKATGESRLYGRFIASADEDEEAYHRPYKDVPSRDSILLPAGEWEITTYTSNAGTVESTSKYTQDVMDDGGELFYRLESYDNLPEKYAYWYDRNSYNLQGGWVDVPLKSSVCLARATLLVDEYASDRKTYSVKLKPRGVAQKINLSFEAKVVDPGIEVTDIVCAISGIPDAMNISTMELDIEKTHQAIFETTTSPTSGGNILAKSTLYVLGLVRSSSASLLQGPGILNVSVFVKYTDDEGNPKERRLDATVNLYHLLSATPSVEYNEAGNVVQACQTMNLHVRSTMLISKTKLSNADDALDSWVDNTEINVEN